MRRSILPLVLVGVGVMSLIGCIYIPATRALQSNNKRRPEAIVGRHKPIEPGKTPLVDAILAANAQIADDDTHQSSASNGLFMMYARSRPMVRIAEDGRSVALSYSLRVGNIVWPLCFASQNDIQTRWLILKADDRDVVAGTQTCAELPPELQAVSSGPTPSGRFSRDDLDRMHAAGIIFASDELEQLRTEREQGRQEWPRRKAAATQPTAQP